MLSPSSPSRSDCAFLGFAAPIVVDHSLHTSASPSPSAVRLADNVEIPTVFPLGASTDPVQFLSSCFDPVHYGRKYVQGSEERTVPASVRNRKADLSHPSRLVPKCPLGAGYVNSTSGLNVGLVSYDSVMASARTDGVTARTGCDETSDAKCRKQSTLCPISKRLTSATPPPKRLRQLLSYRLAKAISSFKMTLTMWLPYQIESTSVPICQRVPARVGGSGSLLFQSRDTQWFSRTLKGLYAEIQVCVNDLPKLERRLADDVAFLVARVVFA